MLPIETTKIDDEQFIKSISKMFEDIAFRYHADELFLTKIDNWFDHKWLGFSGKQLIELETGLPIKITEGNPVWYGGDKVTLPPFSPNRILGQWHFNIPSDNSPLVLTSKRLHPNSRKKSSENLSTRVLEISPCGLLIWFSSNTKNNGRGSILVYHTRDEKIFTWYAAIERRNKWIVAMTKNIDTDAVRKVFENYSA